MLYYFDFGSDLHRTYALCSMEAGTPIKSKST